MRCYTEGPTFALEAYFSNVIATQHTFRNRYNLASLTPVPDRRSIATWVITFRQTTSVTRRRAGVPRSIRSSEKIEVVRPSMLRSPRHFTHKHTSFLGLSNGSMGRILYDDLHFHPYKMPIMQKLSERSLNSLVCGSSRNRSWGRYCFFSGEAHFHLCESVNKQNQSSQIASKVFGVT